MNAAVGPRRFVVYGAGAVGGGIAGRLHQAGADVVVIARGGHLDALQRRGLRLESPDGPAATVPLVAVGAPDHVDWRAGDVVVLGMKGQDTVAALDELRAATDGTDVAVVCAQNGVANEQEALRRFPAVYGMCVMMPAVHLEAGSVRLYAAPVPGNLDVGRYPSGRDDVAEGIGAALTAAGFSSLAVPDVMRWKYTKLLLNLGNAIQALCGAGNRGGELYQRARDEGEAALTAAGIEWASSDEDRERRRTLTVPPPPDTAAARPGGSSWQSLARSTGSIETDFLNGEIVLLGRRFGVATPVNEALQRLAAVAARERWAPGRLTPDDILAASSS